MFMIVFEYKYSTPSLMVRETLDEARTCAQRSCPSAIRASIYEHQPLNTNLGTMQELVQEVVERKII